jgi:hypothetical protein
LPPPKRCQLWGAALPTNSPGVPCILDPVARVGVCGDWLTRPGAGDAASMQAAALSGLELGERLAALVARCRSNGGQTAGDLSDLAIGLEEPFAPVPNHDIGGFPGAQPQEAIDAAAAAAAAAGARGGAGRGGGGRRGGGGGGRSGGQEGQLRQREQREPVRSAAA